MLFWIIKHNIQPEVRLVEYDDFTVLISPCVYMAIFSSPPPSPPLDDIRLTPRVNVGTWEYTTGTICDSADGPAC